MRAEVRECLADQILDAGMHIDDANNTKMQEKFLAELAKVEARGRVAVKWTSERMKVLKITSEQPFVQSLWVDSADLEKWSHLVNSFILRHYYIRDEEFAGDTELAFANFLKFYPDQPLVQRTLACAARNNQQIIAPAKIAFSPIDL